MIFIVESSRVPIYNRIAIAFCRTLIELGHTAHFIDTDGFEDNEFVRTINGIDYDYYLSTNELNRVQKYNNDLECFNFELVEAKLIFIHHDNIFSCLKTLEDVYKKTSGYFNASKRSTHFCIEPRNIEFLKQMGVMSAYKITHASEFVDNLINPNHYEDEVSFVGHVMTGLRHYPLEALEYQSLIIKTYWSKIHDNSYSVGRNFAFDINTFSQSKSKGELVKYPEPIIFNHYVGQLNKLSSAFRGDILKSVDEGLITIIGGDLSYGKISDPLLKFDLPHIRYKPATSDYQHSSVIYKNSFININITSLQFDYAMNPRVLDVMASGGFLLTDYFEEGPVILDNFDEICFRNSEELKSKISHFRDYRNRRKYNEIKENMCKQVRDKFSYQLLIDSILEKI